MPKRLKKGDASGLALLIVVGAIVLGVSKTVDSIGVATTFVIGAGIIGALLWASISRRRARLEYLRAKYGNEEIVQRIMRHSFWEGQTSAQLIDSLGNPLGVDQKVLKTKKREIWKYNRQGSNRYGLRITLDEDTVVGWDEKSHH